MSVKDNLSGSDKPTENLTIDVSAGAYTTSGDTSQWLYVPCFGYSKIKVNSRYEYGPGSSYDLVNVGTYNISEGATSYYLGRIRDNTGWGHNPAYKILKYNITLIP